MNRPRQVFPKHGCETNHRILVVDDNQAIHDDFRKILGADAAETEFDAEEAKLFRGSADTVQRVEFEMDFAYQGQEALELVRSAVAAGRRYAMVFMDVRMPPGWDGLETTLELWKVDPDLQIVICTAYSDYSWDEMMKMIVTPERVLILKKPFDSIEVLQFAHALTEKWSLLQVARQNAETLELTVKMRTLELDTANVHLEAEIIKQKAAAAHIREQAMLIEQARDAIIVRDMDDIILFWNHGAERIYGWTAAEAVGRDVLDLFFQGKPGHNVREARKAVLEEGGWNGEMLQKTRDGRTVSVECHWTLLFDSQGKPKSVLGINTDITEKKRIEEQLLRVQRLDSIGTLASGIAHDLNNILAPILMGCDLLGRNPVKDREIVKTLRQNTQRGADLVSQVLSFARGREGQRIELDVKHLVKEVGIIIRETFPKDICIEVNPILKLWTICADPTQIHQVLMNLCVNARDAMPGGGTLTLEAGNLQIDDQCASAHPGIKPGHYIMITLTDTGTGIPAEIKEKIFDPFFTTKEIGKGTGLGLSTTFGIVKSHGGFINFDSEPTRGTAFRVYIPAKMGVAPVVAETKEGPLPRGRGELILVVDDEIALLKITQRTLEAFGYRVLAAKDGFEAIVIFKENWDKIAAVLTDMMMPLMDGLVLIQSLTAIKPDVIVVAASGIKAETQMEKVLEAGAKHFLSKPYGVRTLLDILDEVLHAGNPVFSKLDKV